MTATRDRGLPPFPARIRPSLPIVFSFAAFRPWPEFPAFLPEF